MTLVLVEIVGPERINRAGASIAPQKVGEVAARFANSLTSYLRSLLHLLGSPAGSKGDERRRRAWTDLRSNPLTFAFTGAAFVVTCLCLIIAPPDKVKLALLAGPQVGVLVVGVIVTGTTSLTKALSLLLLGTAQLMQVRALDRLSKVLALLLVALGFHFDYLAS